MKNDNNNMPSRESIRPWADSHQTHIAVATAIQAIADHSRSAEQIWEDPTPAEWNRVGLTVEQYVREGDFTAEEDGRYPWGEEEILVTLSVEIEGKKVQIDRSGQGHAWSAADEDSCPADIQAEIAAEIIDGRRVECSDYVALNGLHYRWS